MGFWADVIWNAGAGHEHRCVRASLVPEVVSSAVASGARRVLAWYECGGVDVFNVDGGVVCGITPERWVAIDDETYPHDDSCYCTSMYAGYRLVSKEWVDKMEKRAGMTDAQKKKVDDMTAAHHKRLNAILAPFVERAMALDSQPDDQPDGDS